MEGEQARQPKPRPHQIEALDALVRLYNDGADRAQLRMACGTGKTLIGPWLAQRLGARTVVVFVPSRVLVAQLIDAWHHSGVPIRSLAVHSEPTTEAGRDEIGASGIDPYAENYDGEDVTTNPGVIRKFLQDHSGDAETIALVVSTYHSSHLVAKALRNSRFQCVDLMIADEAHNLAGRVDARFLPVLDTSAVRARRRLFQTATPVVLGNLGHVDPIDELSGVADHLHSMDDESTFGPVAFNLSVGEAVTRGMLTDYRVVVGALSESSLVNGPADRPSAVSLAVLNDTVRNYGVRRILTFHNRVVKARQFADAVNNLGALGGVRAQAFSIDGTMPGRQRQDILERLANTPDETVTIVSSARCLQEGVDVPAVDAVVFADPRTSAAGIIQAIGRVLRPHRTKSVGTIVIPAVVDDAGDDQEQLADSSFRHVWRVLRGLRAHDERVAADIRKARAAYNATSTRRDSRLLPWLTVVAENPDVVTARLLGRTSVTWETYFEMAKSFAQKQGGAHNITAQTLVNGKNLGQWVVEQRIRYHNGLLAPERVERLESIDGWHWVAASAADRRSLMVLDDIIAERGSLIENPTGTSIYAGRTDGLNRPLEQWVAAQVFKHRDGELDPSLAEELEQRPGWTWRPLPPADDEFFEAFRRFVAWEGHTDVPADHVEDELPLGRWLADVRRRKFLGTVHPALASMLVAAAPTTGTKGARSFAWKVADVAWDVGMSAARQYVARTGAIDPMPVNHVEDVEGQPFRLYQWVARLRYLHSKGKLSADRAADLASLPGWKWSAGRSRISAKPPKDLGGTSHGYWGYVKGCECQTCLDGNRAYHRASRQSRAEEVRADWIEASEAVAHIQALLNAAAEFEAGERQLVTRSSIAAAASVPASLVHRLVSGSQTRCHPVDHQSLLEVTIESIRAITSFDKRGRPTTAGYSTALVDPAPTWELVDKLIALGWTEAAIVAGMGYSRTNSLPFGRDRVTRQVAKRLELFVESLGGDLTPPPAAANRKQRALASRTRVRVRYDAESEQRARELLVQGVPIPDVARRTRLPQPAVAAIAAASGIGREQAA